MTTPIAAASAWPQARLYFVTDAGAGDRVLGARSRAARTCCSCAIRTLGDDELLEAAARFRALCDEHGALFG